jgi:hypothetical protein
VIPPYPWVRTSLIALVEMACLVAVAVTFQANAVIFAVPLTHRQRKDTSSTASFPPCLLSII